MNARNTPAQKKRQYHAARRKLRRDVAEFKKFVATALRQLEAGRDILIIANVVKDPCGDDTKFISRLVKGQPNPPSE